MEYVFWLELLSWNSLDFGLLLISLDYSLSIDDDYDASWV
jgi:hypothetical protein